MSLRWTERDRRVARYIGRWAKAPFTGFKTRWDAVAFWVGVLMIPVGKLVLPALPFAADMGVTAEGLLWQIPLAAVAIIAIARVILWPAQTALALEDESRGASGGELRDRMRLLADQIARLENERSEQSFKHSRIEALATAAAKGWTVDEAKLAVRDQGYEFKAYNSATLDIYDCRRSP